MDCRYVTEWKCICTVHSLTSPYRHLHNMDTSLSRTVRLDREMPKIIHTLPL